MNLLSEKEYQQVIYDWNKTKRAYPQDKTIHGLFEEQVAKTPSNIAVIYDNTQLTYEELNQRANQLANYLRTVYKITGDDLIALCLDRSQYMLVAILGVLKAGGAYVPMDPTYPKDRISYILNDTKAKVLITTCHSHNTCHFHGSGNLDPSLHEDDRVYLDSDEFIQVLKKYSTSNPQPNINSNNLAYVIYTSGTTGKPKGVALQHQGIINRITWMNNEYPLVHTDRILQKTPYIFDVSVWELFWANWYGATIVFSHPGRHKEVDYLIDVIEEKKVTVIHFVPSMLDVFNQELLSQHHLTKCLTSLRYIFCSGEALKLRQVREVPESTATCKTA